METGKTPAAPYHIDVESLRSFCKRAAKTSLILTVLAVICVGLVVIGAVLEINKLRLQKKAVMTDTGELQRLRESLGGETSRLQQENTRLAGEAATLREQAEKAQTASKEAAASLADSNNKLSAATTAAAESQKQIDARKSELAGLATQGRSDLEAVTAQIRALAGAGNSAAKIKAQTAVALAQASLDAFTESAERVAVPVPTAASAQSVQKVQVRYGDKDGTTKSKLPEIEKFLADQGIMVVPGKDMSKVSAMTEVRYAHYPEDTAGAGKLLEQLTTKFKLKTGRVTFVLNPDLASGAFEVSIATGDMK